MRGVLHDHEILRRLEALERDVERLHTRMEGVQLSVSDEQGQVNALATELQGVQAAVQQITADLATAQATLQTELNNLQAQIQSGAQPDLSGLQAAADALAPLVASADSAAQALGGLTPTPPAAPAAEQAPAPEASA